MNPSKKGWLQEYLNFRKDKLKDYHSDKLKAALPEQALYRIIQPTGLMYGQSISALDHPDSVKWKEKDRLKILLAESLIGSAIVFADKSVNKDEGFVEVVNRTIDSVNSFYNQVFPELATSDKTWFGKQRTPNEVAEQILDKRIDAIVKSTDNFWVKFFNRSLLFLDIYTFSQWVHTRGDQVVADFFKYQREELRLSVVKVITSAAHANKTVEFEERKLLDYFLQSAGLSSEKKKEARDIFEQGVEIEGIELPTNNSWILRKYYLEMAILTIWADKQVERAELEFLNRLAKHLSFSKDDLETSIIALEGFVLQHWVELGDLQDKVAFEQMSDQYIQRVAGMARQHKPRLLMETKGNKKIISLLKQANTDELTMDEKLALRDELIGILKVIPNFNVLSLPQRFLSLPVLMKILPREFFAEALS